MAAGRPFRYSGKAVLPRQCQAKVKGARLLACRDPRVLTSPSSRCVENRGAVPVVPLPRPGNGPMDADWSRQQGPEADGRPPSPARHREDATVGGSVKLARLRPRRNAGDGLRVDRAVLVYSLASQRRHCTGKRAQRFDLVGLVSVTRPARYLARSHPAAAIAELPRNSRRGGVQEAFRRRSTAMAVERPDGRGRRRQQGAGGRLGLGDVGWRNRKTSMATFVPREEAERRSRH